MLRVFTFIFLLMIASLPARATSMGDVRLAATYQAVHAEQLIRAADITLVGITSLFSHQETSAINDLIIHNSLNRHVDRVPGLNALFITDVEGRLKHDSFRFPTRNLNLKDRAYINEALQLSANELYIGAPIKNQVVAFASLPLSRPIFNELGHLTGVGVAIVTPDNLLQRSKICKKCVVSVFRSSGEKIVSFPAALQAHPDILDFMQKHAENEIAEIQINRLPTRSVWIKIANYDLVLLYSYFI